ncbi:MAG TPA: response regulator [Chloroflexota bacterium]|nr:response regulator [Chloroflexota bacterium]
MIDQEARLRTLRHDARTLVNHIVGYAELLAEDAEQPARRKLLADLRTIIAASQEILEFVTIAMTVDGASQGRLAPGLVHQGLRLPVHTIVAYIELLAEDAAAGGWDEALPDLQKMMTAAWQLLATVGRELGLELSPREAYEAQADRAAAAPSDRVPAAAGSAGRVLVVDDNPMNRDILRRRLEPLGYAVEVAGDGHAAIERLGQAAFDAILLDLHMPPPSGYEVLRQVKATPAMRDVPVVVVSATDSAETIRQCAELGAAGYLVTPVRTDELRERLATVLKAAGT